MAYELQEQLLTATDGGLQIILKYYPQAADTIGSRDKKFKVREDERTPSASLKKLTDGNWVVTDFGGDQTPRNGIQVCMNEEGLSYREAMAKLCGEYHIGGINQDINKPGFEFRDARADEPEGEYYFETNDKISERELKLLGPVVTQKVCDEYNFYSLKSFTYIKNRKALVTTATENYPIFLIDHGTWKKIYQPLSFDKQYRFRYVGEKPKDLINGLKQLEKRNAEFRKEQEREHRDDDKEWEMKRYPEAILASGERDALNIAGLGYVPLWMNSETASLSPENYKLIMKECEALYILPDIDRTGIRAATDLCLKYLDIRMIILPETLKKFKDSRGNSRKDFRDYVEIYPHRKDFQKLIDVAMPMKFWDATYSDKGVKYYYKPSQAFQFLQANGFWKIENKNTRDGEEFIQIDGNVVTPVTANEIKAFMFRFCEERFLPIDLRDMLHSTTKLSESSLSGLKQINIDFTDFDENSQYIFFRNKTLKVTANGIKVFNAGDVDKYVWGEEVIDHNFKYDANHPFIAEYDRETGCYDIKSIDTKSKFFSFLINASRVFWREELEVRMAGMSEEDQAKYRKDNEFNIAGPKLTDEEREIQKAHLLNKIFSIGYLLHRYKNDSKPWAVWATDNKLSPDDEAHGRSGKSFTFKAVRMFMKTVTLPGRNPKLTDNPHMYDRVTEHTDLIVVDDADRYLNFKVFFDAITGELIVNPKNNQSYEIPFEHSAKFVFTSNFVLRDIDPSTEARLIYNVYSDYYHEKGEGDEYRETRKISDSFGKNLFKEDYSEDEWNADFNFFAHCLRFYLSVHGSQKLNAPMGNVTQRQDMTIMGQQFKDWADVYMPKDEFAVRSIVMKEFSDKSQVKGWTTQKFSKAVKAWCHFNNYVLNPACFQNSSGRIVRKFDGTAEDMIYIQTKPIDSAKLAEIAAKDADDEIYSINVDGTPKLF